MIPEQYRNGNKHDLDPPILAKKKIIIPRPKQKQDEIKIVDIKIVAVSGYNALKTDLLLIIETPDGQRYPDRESRLIFTK